MIQTQFGKFKRRALAALLSVSILFTMTGAPVYAVSDNTVKTGLCEHHTEHTAECGYAEAEPGTPCNHEHTEDCYKLVENCIHEHTAECYPEEEGVSDHDATPSNTRTAEPTECTHVCSEETGCITKVLECPHEHKVNGGEADREGGLGHDADCGYTPGTEGSPCAFVCEICNKGVEELIDNALPVQTITAWEWNDPDGYLALNEDTGEWELALPGVSEDNPVDFDTVVSMLPKAVSAELEDGEQLGDIALMGWKCAAFQADENGTYPASGAFSFAAEFPKEYALSDTVKQPEVTVLLGGGDFLTINDRYTVDGLA